MGGPIRLAILGCGEITRLGHLPAAAKHQGVQVVGLVDSDVNRARNVAKQFHLDCQVVPDYKPLLQQVDALINALPNWKRSMPASTYCARSHWRQPRWRHRPVVS
jgi:predicted dehydrogenase